MADRLIAAGVRSLLNFAPGPRRPRDVLLRYVDLSIELQVMSFYLSRRTDDEAGERMPVIRSVGLTPAAAG